MAEGLKETTKPIKKKVVRCDKTCTYVATGGEGRRCKNKCDKEPGHILNCKCRNHEMQ